MARLRHPATPDTLLDALPSSLRTFSPGVWLARGENAADPIAVHCHAWRRWQHAIADELGIRDLLDIPDPGAWWGPILGRDDCPCTVCSGQ